MGIIEELQEEIKVLDARINELCEQIEKLHTIIETAYYAQKVIEEAQRMSKD